MRWIAEFYSVYIAISNNRVYYLYSWIVLTRCFIIIFLVLQSWPPSARWIYHQKYLYSFKVNYTIVCDILSDCALDDIMCDLTQNIPKSTNPL